MPLGQARRLRTGPQVNERKVGARRRRWKRPFEFPILHYDLGRSSSTVTPMLMYVLRRSGV